VYILSSSEKGKWFKPFSFFVIKALAWDCFALGKVNILFYGGKSFK